MIKLTDLKTGESATIVKILGHGAFRKRVMEMGFVRGKNIKVLLNAPLQDPIKYNILGYEVSLRRSEAELPARVEEVHHAKEEGIVFKMLTNPTEIIGNEKGWVEAISCVEMELGEPDESGRRSPVVKEGSDFRIDCDVVIMALGTSPNPLIKATTKGLETNRRGCIVADEMGQTSRQGVFAGGDAVTGAATVILAMGAGRKAAAAIDKYLQQ